MYFKRIESPIVLLGNTNCAWSEVMSEAIIEALEACKPVALVMQGRIFTIDPHNVVRFILNEHEQNLADYFAISQQEE